MNDKRVKFAVVGHPNVGKSSLINAVSCSHLKVGNFSGVTIEKQSAELTYIIHPMKLIDLPGIHTLHLHEEEAVTLAFLKN